jgi:hypothetical protein
VPLVVARVASRPVIGLVRDGQLKLRPFAAPAFLLFAASDLVDDPGLEHGMTFFYGLQHRRLSVKKADADRHKRRKIDRLRAQAGCWPTCSKKDGPGRSVTQVSWF